MIIGEVEVTGTVGGSPEEVWQQTAELSGISRELFDSYYAGKERAIAYRLGEVRKYESPKRLRFAAQSLRAAPRSHASECCIAPLAADGIRLRVLRRYMPLLQNPSPRDDRKRRMTAVVVVTGARRFADTGFVTACLERHTP